MENKILNLAGSIETENMLASILDHMEVLDGTIEKNRLDGICLELFKQVIELGDKWHFIWEENYCE